MIIINDGRNVWSSKQNFRIIKEIMELQFR